MCNNFLWIHQNNKLSDQEKAAAATRGVLAGVLNTEDYSNGAYFWQGVDFRKHYKGVRACENFYKVGFKFADKTHDIWHIGNHLSGKKSYQYMFESTGAAEKTTFMKYTNQYKHADRHTREWP